MYSYFKIIAANLCVLIICDCVNRLMSQDPKILITNYINEGDNNTHGVWKLVIISTYECFRIYKY